MRSHGQVRFIKVTSRVQIGIASLLFALLLGWAISMAAVAIGQWQASHERESLLNREAKVASAESRWKAYGDDLDEVADDLRRRQDFIEAVLPMLPDDVRPEEKVSDSSDEAAKTVEKVSAAIPEAAPLADLEARQLAFVERLTRFADRRSKRAEDALRKLGLNPRSVVATNRGGLGGPLNKLSTSRDGTLDPRFERLGASLERMDALERGLAGVPQVMPADRSSISSGFGYRRDPFNGHAAMHAGLDFAGGYGAPIHAAAEGKVSFVGTRSGYGNVVEVSHGSGLMTRYAHMSQTKAHVGQKVEAGDIIGAIGSTGRSTGPHLHFEVRINGRAVNPRPFLENAPHVLEEARALRAKTSDKSHG